MTGIPSFKMRLKKAPRVIIGPAVNLGVIAILQNRITHTNSVGRITICKKKAFDAISLE